MVIGISGKAGSGKNLVAGIWQYLTIYEGNVGKVLKAVTEDNWDSLSKKEREEKSGWQEKLFAYKLKEIVCTLTGCTMENLESQEFKFSKLPKEWEVVKLIKEDGTWFVKTIKEFEKEYSAKNIFDECESMSKLKDLNVVKFERFIPTYREFLQIIGTDLFRTFIHPNTWVISTMSDYKPTTFKWNDGNYMQYCKFCNKEFTGCKHQMVCEDCCETVKLYPNWIVTDARFINECEAILNTDDNILIRVNRKNNTSNNSTHASEIELDSYDRFHYIIDNNGTIEELINKVRNIMIEKGIF